MIRVYGQEQYNRDLIVDLSTSISELMKAQNVNNNNRFNQEPFFIYNNYCLYRSLQNKTLITNRINETKAKRNRMLVLQMKLISASGYRRTDRSTIPYYQYEPYAFYYYTENNDEGDSYTPEEFNNLNPKT